MFLSYPRQRLADKPLELLLSLCAAEKREFDAQLVEETGTEERETVEEERAAKPTYRRMNFGPWLHDCSRRRRFLQRETLHLPRAAVERDLRASAAANVRHFPDSDTKHDSDTGKLK